LFEVWDHDLIGNDYMGHNYVSLDQIREKQLLKRSTSGGNNSKQMDEQKPIQFILNLQQKAGVKNEGADFVSGNITVSITFFQLNNETTNLNISEPLTRNISGGNNLKKAPQEESIRKLSAAAPPPLEEQRSLSNNGVNLQVTDLLRVEIEEKSHSSNSRKNSLTSDSKNPLVSEEKKVQSKALLDKFLGGFNKSPNKNNNNKLGPTGTTATLRHLKKETLKREMAKAANENQQKQSTVAGTLESARKTLQKNPQGEECSIM
jgi:hypothetical protein